MTVETELALATTPVRQRRTREKRARLLSQDKPAWSADKRLTITLLAYPQLGVLGLELHFLCRAGWHLSEFSVL